MSTSAVSCGACGARIPPESRFCPSCGVRLPGNDGTAVLDVPPHETTASPVHVLPPEPRFYGVTPPVALLMLCVAALAVAVLLLARGDGWAGTLVLFGAIALFVAFLRIGRQSAVERARERGTSLVERFSVSTATRRELLRLRYALEQDAATRERLLRDLGAAVYSGDEAGTERLRDELRALSEATAAKEEQMKTISATASERIGRSRLQVQRTVLLEPQPPTPSPDPGGPVIVPEPYPPDEATPPTPAPVPEPYPPPDEGSPPQT